MGKKKRWIASPAGVTARGTASEAVGWEDLFSFPPVAVSESIDDAAAGGAPVAPFASPDAVEAVPPSATPSLLTSPSAADVTVSTVAPAASAGCASSPSAALEVSVAVGASPVPPRSVADAVSGSSNAVSGRSNAASAAIGLKGSSMRLARLRAGSRQTMRSSASIYNEDRAKKLVWLWTENVDVMTAAVESGWNTFVFSSEPRSRKLANEWYSIAMIHPLFVKGSEIIDAHNVRVAVLYDVSSPTELKLLLPDYQQDNTVVINFQSEWQVISAENIVAAIQGCGRSVLAVSTTSTEAQVFLEALEQGLDGVVLKVTNLEEVFKLKDYFNRRNELHNFLELTKATITKVEVVGMGDRVCIDLCSLMKPGEGLLVGSFARGLFLIHSECLESNYIASRPFRVNAGPVHAYVAVPGGKTCYLSELRAGKEVIVANQSSLQRTAIVGRSKIETRPLILVEALDSDNMTYSLFVQNVETVGLVCPHEGEKSTRTAIPVTSLKCGDEVLLRVQGGARHTGIEIQEFIIEK